MCEPWALVGFDAVLVPKRISGYRGGGGVEGTFSSGLSILDLRNLTKGATMQRGYQPSTGWGGRDKNYLALS